MLRYIFLFSCLFHSSHAACPNACSLNGLCDFYDMCNCFSGFTGGDCSERICPIDYSFVTTPQGDLNMDGDRDDNSWRRLPQSIRTFKVGGDTMTMNGAFDRLEVDFGDLVKVTDQVYEIHWACTYTVTNQTDCLTSNAAPINEVIGPIVLNTGDSGRRLASGVKAAPPTPSESMCRSCTRSIDYPNRAIGERWTELTVESRMEGLLHGFVGVWADMENELLTDNNKKIKPVTKLDGYPLYRHLRTQANPYGTWEKWPGDFYGSGQQNGAKDEGHFYMECSNRGHCNRDLGMCECHAGYTGLACRLQQCPGLKESKGKKAGLYAVGVSCNGHGTCTTVGKLSEQQPQLLQGKVSTAAGSKYVQTAQDFSLELYVGDEIMIGSTHDVGHSFNNGADTLNERSLLMHKDHSGNLHRTYTVVAINPNFIELNEKFPITFMYGTSVYKRMKYTLWDRNKNRACQCNSRYHGNDCKLRKCPVGDDPLTELGYDNTDSTSAKEDSSQRASFYEQSAEKQTIYMSTNGGRLFGTFRLTMEDSYGDRWTTRPIPTKVRLSIVPRDSPTYTYNADTGEVEEFGVTIDFGYDSVTGVSSGLSINEIGIGDVLQCGDEYRIVQQLFYADGTTKKGRSTYRYIKTSGTMRSIEAGRPWYRITMSKEIRAALIHLPIERLKDVTVEGIFKTGKRMNADVNTYLNTNRAEFYNAVSNTENPEDTFVIGDYMRVGKELRQVLSITTPQLKYSIQPFHYPTTFSGAFKHTGMDYEISFHSGCTKHSDCQRNGMNEFDSDHGSGLSMTLGREDGATCHPGGICLCSDPTVYSGDGCTRSGKGSHASIYKYRPLPGDLPLLHCDTRGLFAGQTLDVTGEVLRSSPTVLVLSNTPSFPKRLYQGDYIYINNQQRQIITIEDHFINGGPNFVNGPVTVTVNAPFEETKNSSYSHYIRPKSAIQRRGSPERNEEESGRYGNFARCLVTDLRPLSDETLFCDKNVDRPNCGKGTVSGSGSMLNRIVTFGGRSSDPNDFDSDSNTDERVPGIISSIHEIKIGDRLRIITTGHVNGVAPIWETRTVDSVTYAHTPMGCIPSEKVIVGCSVSFGYTNGHDMKPVYIDTSGTTEAKVCSGRGLCEEETGLCKCFHGYGWGDCSSQEALQM